MRICACLIALFLGACENSPEDDLKQGIELFEQGDFKEAALALKTANQGDQQTGETYFYLALLDEKNKHYANMRENLLSALELLPDNTKVKLKLGNLFLNFNEVDKALDEANEVLALDENNLSAFALKAAVLVRQKKQDEALYLIHKILEQDPVFTEALTLQASIHVLNKEIDDAILVIDKAIESDETDVSLHLFKIQIEANRNNKEAVTAQYRKLIELFPTNDEYKITLAKIHNHNNDSAKAEKVFRDLVDLRPNQPEPKILLLSFLASAAPGKVVEQFRLFTRRHSDQPRLLIKISKTMLALQEFEEVNTAMKRVVKIEEDTKVGLEAKTILAKIALQRNDVETGTKLIDEILDANKNHLQAKILKSRVLLYQNKTEQAILLLNKVNWAKPNSDEVLVLLAQAYLKNDDKAKAEEHFSLALAANPSNLLALMPIINQAMDKKNIGFVRDTLRKALRYKRGNVLILQKLIQVEMEEKNWDVAQRYVNVLAVRSGSAKRAKFLSAYILQQKEQCEQAILVYQALLKQDPDNMLALENMSECYESLGKRKEIKVIVAGMLKKDPGNVSVSVLLSELLLTEQAYDQSAVIIKDLIKVNGDISLLYEVLANISLEQEDWQNAVEIYQQGLEKMPGNVHLSLLLASAYENQTNYSESEQIYEALLIANPKLDAAANNLAVLLADHFQEEEKLLRASQLAEKFKNVDQIYFQDTYAWVEINRGNITEGLEILREIVNVKPNHASFRFHLGFAYYKNRNYARAVGELRQAIDLYVDKKDFPEKQRAMQLYKSAVAKIRGR